MVWELPLHWPFALDSLLNLKIQFKVRFLSFNSLSMSSVPGTLITFTFFFLTKVWKLHMAFLPLIACLTLNYYIIWCLLMVSFHVYSHIFSLLILADLFLHSQLKNYRTFFLTFLNGYISFSKIQKSVCSLVKLSILSLLKQGLAIQTRVVLNTGDSPAHWILGLKTMYYHTQLIFFFK